MAHMKTQALLKKALAANSKAAAVFDELPPSHRKEYVNWIAGAKKEETLHRRLDQLVPMLLKKQTKR
jgi:uncharacterized protein YdeI (YjbR/CyaY-like superfamily)